MQAKGIPYFPISQFYKERFGQKVHKVPVTIAQTCPNREGLKGMKVCIFCDEWGSAAYPENQKMKLREQIEKTRLKVKKRTHCHAFLIYFQAYTSTYSKVAQVREQFEVASEYDDVKGFVLGTRPDCLSDSLFDLWNEYAEQKYLAVELGVQSFNNQQLEWMERGHTGEKSVQGIFRVHKSCPHVDLGIHLMFGFPGESVKQVKETARLINALPVNNVKLHNLHVLSNTPLEQMYLKKEYTPETREQYAEKVSVFLQELSPKIAVHRLSALASRREELVAPWWASQRMENYQYFIDALHEKKSFQGKDFVPLDRFSSWQEASQQNWETLF